MAVDRSPCHDGIQLPVVVRECIDYVEEFGMSQSRHSHGFLTYAVVTDLIKLGGSRLGYWIFLALKRTSHKNCPVLYEESPSSQVGAGVLKMHRLGSQTCNQQVVGLNWSCRCQLATPSKLFTTCAFVIQQHNLPLV